VGVRASFGLVPFLLFHFARYEHCPVRRFSARVSLCNIDQAGFEIHFLIEQFKKNSIWCMRDLWEVEEQRMISMFWQDQKFGTQTAYQ
jgi:hypothetical protein